MNTFDAVVLATMSGEAVFRCICAGVVLAGLLIVFEVDDDIRRPILRRLGWRWCPQCGAVLRHLDVEEVTLDPINPGEYMALNAVRGDVFHCPSCRPIRYFARLSPGPIKEHIDELV